MRRQIRFLEPVSRFVWGQRFRGRPQLAGPDNVDETEEEQRRKALEAEETSIVAGVTPAGTEEDDDEQEDASESESSAGEGPDGG